MAYKVITVDLATAVPNANPVKLISRDQKITEVTIPKFSGDISIAFGNDADLIPIDAPISFKPTGEDGKKGLFYSNPVAQVGVTVALVVGFADGLDVDVRV